MFNPNNSPPDIDPAEKGSLMGLFKQVLRKNTQSIDGMIPAKVISFNRASNTVVAQPTISIVAENGTATQRANIAGLPVLQIGGGGFFLNHNLKAGDQGWIVAGDRDPANYLATNNNARPATYETKKYSFGFFIPGVLTGYEIAGGDSNNTVLQSLDGTVKISLGETGIVISAPSVQIISSGETSINASGDVNVSAGGDANITAGGSASITASSLTGTITSDCTITTPLLRVVGNINASGSITPSVP